MEELINMANAGDVNAQEKVGTAYMKGTNGVEKNVEEAIKYFKMAAQNGSAMANYQIGKAYEKGNGVNQDLEKAKNYYQKSADMGYVNAVNTLKQLGNNTEQVQKVTTSSVGVKYQVPEVKTTIETSTNKNNGDVYSTRGKTIAIVLAIFTGIVGGHNWYLGYTKKAIIQLLLSLVGLFAVSEIWGIVEAVQIGTGKINKDGKGGLLV